MKMDDAVAQLEAQYCPPLDPALFSAILLDYDLSDEKALRDAKSTLDELRESALLEEYAGFDPSGTGGLDETASFEKQHESSVHSGASQSRGTDLTSETTQLSSLSVGEDSTGHSTPDGGLEHIERMDLETKISLLQDLFGEQVNRYSIEHTLKKRNGNWNATMEELLNHVYIGETTDNDGGVTSAKGVDAFFDENAARRGRKGKSKKKRFNKIDEKRSSSLPGASDGGEVQTKNKWETASHDIDFIASRISISRSTVSSMYYEKSASLPRTIAAVLHAFAEEKKGAGPDDAIVVVHAFDLGRDFPTISPEDLTTLTRLTHPSMTAARELAEALAAKPKVVPNGGIEIIPRYSRPVEIESENDWTSVRKAPRSYASSPAPATTLSSAARRDAYALARAAALSKANEARRKAKSDPLMGGAAAYYSEMGREYAVLSSGASAAAADELVDSQSTLNQLDLHGVDVANAMRIASERVNGWWRGLGESRYNGRIGVGERSVGYTIVVGLGRHSEGGRSKLGPAVTKVLRDEGWRLELAGPVIVVKGPVKA